MVSTDRLNRQRGIEGLALKSQAQLNVKIGAARAQPGLSAKDQLAQVETFKKSVGVKALIEGITAVKSVRALLSTRTVPGVELAAIGLVKAAGEEGRLSDQDLQRAGFVITAIDKATSFLKKIALGTPLNATIDEMNEFVDILGGPGTPLSGHH